MTSQNDDQQWTRLIRLHNRVEQQLAEALQQRHAIGLSEFRALCRLAQAEDGELRMQELSEAIGLNQSSVSRLVSRLQNAGLAERSFCEKDRRGVYTVITEPGRDHLAKAMPTYRQTLTTALDEAHTEAQFTPLTEQLRSTA